jgi:hypothetical protein
MADNFTQMDRRRRAIVEESLNFSAPGSPRISANSADEPRTAAVIHAQHHAAFGKKCVHRSAGVARGQATRDRLNLSNGFNRLS